MEFEVAFDVIEGYLPFLLGLPSLFAMGATLDHKYHTLVLIFNGKYHRLQMEQDGDHLYMPLKCQTVVLFNKGHGGDENRSGGQKYYSRGTVGRKYHSTGQGETFEKIFTITATAGVISFNKSPSYCTIFASVSNCNVVGKSTGNSESNNVTATSSNVAEEASLGHIGVKYYTPVDIITSADHDSAQEGKSMEEDDLSEDDNLSDTPLDEAKLADATLDEASLDYDTVDNVNLDDSRLGDVLDMTMTTNNDATMTTYKKRIQQNKSTLCTADIKKLHIQPRHDTATEIENYIRAAGLWDNTLEQTIEDVIISCPCRTVSRSAPHAKVATRPPSTESQANISIDVILIGGRNYIHTVDECTSWSEAGHIQYIRHGPLKTIR